MESEAPSGYRLDTTSHSFTITAAVRDHAFAAPFVNTKVDVPTIPLTGGRGAHVFLIAGAVLGGLALAVATLRRHRTRRSQH